jgi:hypothetical protein
LKLVVTPQYLLFWDRRTSQNINILSQIHPLVQHLQGNPHTFKPQHVLATQTTLGVTKNPLLQAAKLNASILLVQMFYLKLFLIFSEQDSKFGVTVVFVNVFEVWNQSGRSFECPNELPQAPPRPIRRKGVRAIMLATEAALCV